ncbi:MAG TPA: dTDP-glucose 4,6-dehydratase [bacterium]|nr:dTDP-glucose 4,6-dehydratase [bacterium]HPT29636.1 dTDP-glucose 4,6-dehydratase [bacterium]
MAKLLITGGAGFIGSNFIHYWLTQHPADEIINLDKLTYAGNLANLAGLENNPRYQFVLGDITDSELVEKIVAQVDIIVHFAAESHVDRSILSSAEFIKTNVLGTQVLLEAARKNNTRFHHISTDEVFGALSDTDPKFNEETPYSPRSPYSASKAASDHLVRAYYHTHGLPITISNCSNNYGPRQYPEKLIPLFITNLLDQKKVPVYGQGKNIRDWIHVDDHNRGIDLILQKGRIGETYCLGGNSELSNLEITKQILAELGYDEQMIEYVPDRLGHDFRYAIDFSKAQKELGFSPQINFATGLRETIKWYQENEGWWRPLKK